MNALELVQAIETAGEAVIDAARELAEDGVVTGGCIEHLCIACDNWKAARERAKALREPEENQ